MLQTIFWVFQIAISLMAGYLALLTAAAYRAPRAARPRTASPHQFRRARARAQRGAPAAATARQPYKQRYHRDKYVVHVWPTTATTARRGWRAWPRHRARARRPRAPGKGYALNWLLDHLTARGELGDAVLVVDADSVVSENLLAVMDSLLARGERVVQAALLRPRSGAVVAGEPAQRGADPVQRGAAAGRGRWRLAGLKGNGMAFAAAWRGDTDGARVGRGRGAAYRTGVSTASGWPSRPRPKSGRSCLPRSATRASVRAVGARALSGNQGLLPSSRARRCAGARSCCSTRRWSCSCRRLPS